MNRTLKIAGFTLGGLAVAAGISLVANRLLRNWSEDWLLQEASDNLAPADMLDRNPTSAEHMLWMLVTRYGWPHKGAGVRFGTEDGEPYLLVPLGSCEARLQRVPDSNNEFEIISWGDTPVTGFLARSNPTYEAAVEEFVGE